MIDAVARMALLAVVGGGAWLAAGWWQRRPAGGAVVALPAGITLVTGPGCSLCGPVERALRRAGAVPRVVRIGDVELPAPPVRSLPVALVVDRDGQVVMRRAGRAALDDAPALAARASALAGVSRPGPA